MSTESKNGSNVKIGTDSINGVDLSITTFSDNGCETTFVGTNLSPEELVQKLEELVRQGDSISRFEDLPFPGEPGKIGIAMVRTKDYSGNASTHDWKPKRINKADFRLGQRRFFPLIQECYHSSHAQDNAHDTGVSIKRSTIWSMRETADNLSTGARGFRELNITGARFWLAPDRMETLDILQKQYPTLASDLFTSFIPQWQSAASALVIPK